MNQKSYLIFQDLETFVNRECSNEYLAKFRCPGDSFVFEVYVKSNDKLGFYACMQNELAEDIAEKLAEVIMYGVGYRKKNSWEK